MNIDALYVLLGGAVDRTRIEKNALMKEYTTFKVGGPADLLVRPASTGEIADVIKILKDRDVPFLVIGNGSNLLISDKGFRGVIIRLGSEMSRIDVDGTRVRAQGGALMSAVSKAAADAGLTGLEFAGGIPGSIAGGLFMNAGAYGGELKNVVTDAVVIEEDGQIHEVVAADMGLRYRHSVFQEKNSIIAEVGLSLSQGKREEISETMRELMARRNEKQPLNYPSAGSTFKRPEGHFAGKLIQDSGCMGLTCGGAQVSEKHAGFVINKGGATAADVLDVIHAVQERVMAAYGIHLEPEVRIIGEE